jgi:glutamate--cysteine ligase
LRGAIGPAMARVMSNKVASLGDDAPIENRAQLIGVLENGCKPVTDWRIGTEHEKFVYRKTDFAAPSYAEPNGIRDLLLGMESFGWEPIFETGPAGNENVIALKGPDGNISLEPAGQFELSGAPLESIHDTCAESNRHLAQCREIGDRLGLGFLSVGFWPDKTRAELPVMPKGRYAIMLRHMPRVGGLGLDMMLRTCTIQTNLDYASEADMVRKFRVSMALQPLATALFANSPFTEGKPNGFKSFRSHIWTDTDPHRTGTLPFVFEDGFGFERYADYALDVPMYFVYRDGRYIDAAGHSFRDFLAGKLAVLPGEKPRLGDWKDHLSTAFPEVRMKGYLEMRGADGGRWDRICALPAFWVGLLYDDVALDAAWQLVKDWTPADHDRLRAEVPRLALQAVSPGGGTLQDLAKTVLAIADTGLARRNRQNRMGDTEQGFLNPLREIAASGKTNADLMLALYAGDWGGDVSKVYAAESY